MRIKGPKLRKKSTSSSEESGIKKDELRNFCERIKWWKLWSCFCPLNSLMFPKKTFHLPCFEFVKKVSQLVQNTFLFLTKNVKKATKWRVHQWKMKLKHAKANLFLQFWPKFRSTPQVSAGLTYSSSRW